MNFTYLNAFPDLKKLSGYCTEAEEFAISNPILVQHLPEKQWSILLK